MASEEDVTLMKDIFKICAKKKKTRSYFFSKAISDFDNTNLSWLQDIDIDWFQRQMVLLA